MTVRLTENSARGIHAARFGAELSKAMRARGVSNLRLAEASASTKSAIANWKVGGNLPRTDTALRLADVLDWPKLVELARAGRSRPCGRCERPFVNEGGAPARFCSVACREVDEQLRRRPAGSLLADVVAEELARVSGTTRQVARRPLKTALSAYRRSEAKRVARVDKLAAQLVGVQSAVDAMCAGCEPMGLCNDMSCALRPVSPLPMASMRETSEIREAEGPWGPTHRDAQLARIREANARRWSRPGERERQAERTRARRKIEAAS